MVNLKNRKAWLRIIEVTISIVLIFGSVLIFYQINNQKSSENIGTLLPGLADQIAKNITLREEIMSLDINNNANAMSLQSQINEFLAEQAQRNDISFASAVCTLNDVCPAPFLANGTNKEIFGYQRIISSSLSSTNNDFNSGGRKIKLFVWKS